METDQPCSVLSPFKALDWTSSEQQQQQHTQNEEKFTILPVLTVSVIQSPIWKITLAPSLKRIKRVPIIIFHLLKAIFYAWEISPGAMVHRYLIHIPHGEARVRSLAQGKPTFVQFGAHPLPIPHLQVTMRRQGSPKKEKKKGGHMSGLVQAASRAPGMTRKKNLYRRNAFFCQSALGTTTPGAAPGSPCPGARPPPPWRRSAGGGTRPSRSGTRGARRRPLGEEEDQNRDMIGIWCI